MPIREVLSINVGQGGIQLGNAIWNQYSAEHDVAEDKNQNVSNSKS